MIREEPGSNRICRSKSGFLLLQIKFEKRPRICRQALSGRTLRRARQADTASHLDEWINSAGLQPPK